MSRVARTLLCGAMMLSGCSEYTVREGAPSPPVADPPGGEDPGDAGTAPDWNSCQEGYLGHYLNLPATHPDLEPLDEAPPVEDPDVYDWWDEDRLSFERFDSSLDMGAGWWPVEEGLTGDPLWFAARWTAWVRATSAGDHDLVLGGTSDVFVLIDGELVASVQGSETFEPVVVPVTLSAGQFPLEVRFAHRKGESALRVRFASEDVAVCFAEYDD
jgi:hypothetical protein